ncbi:hypothetical protein BD311DRAFT_718794 [Dichomitus squalens]|uniref:Uncharacterized protein n=1 Tax=Dichomitus squalens TaxID=114155 RepID=A0A4Q9MUU1_9APHY|nr:hypothetical protein BD311DRAFT_718794 [Dichomitus squalens]
MSRSSTIFISDHDPPSSDTRTFVPSEWIACGKTYPALETPPFILAARPEAALTIPPEYNTLMPNPHTSVLHLLCTDLPPCPSALTSQKASHAFSEDPLNETLRTLFGECSAGHLECRMRAPPCVLTLYLYLRPLLHAIPLL